MCSGIHPCPNHVLTMPKSFRDLWLPMFPENLDIDLECPNCAQLFYWCLAFNVLEVLGHSNCVKSLNYKGIEQVVFRHFG
jgi:hypothetical protein